MTRIGDPSGGSAGARSSLDAERNGRDERSGPHANRDKLGDGLRRDTQFGQLGFGSDAHERETAFSDRMRHALRDKERRPAREDAETSRLLAVAGAALPTTVAASPAVATSPDADPGALDRAARIDRLGQTIETALASSLRDGVSSTFSMHLDLSALGLGSDNAFSVAGLTVTLAPDAVDVVLVRNGQSASPELLAAAQDLADRLHQRFSRRLVRVHEAGDAPAEARAPDGMAAFSSLFARDGSNR